MLETAVGYVWIVLFVVDLFGEQPHFQEQEFGVVVGHRLNCSRILQVGEFGGGGDVFMSVRDRGEFLRQLRWVVVLRPAVVDESGVGPDPVEQVVGVLSGGGDRFVELRAVEVVERLGGFPDVALLPASPNNFVVGRPSWPWSLR